MHKCILTSKRRWLRMECLPTVYDADRQINVVYIDGRAEPAVDQAGNLPTNSKTAAAPGDDDLDYAGEGLY